MGFIKVEGKSVKDKRKNEICKRKLNPKASDEVIEENQLRWICQVKGM